MRLPFSSLWPLNVLDALISFAPPRAFSLIPWRCLSYEMPSTFQARTLDRRIAICYMMYNILLNTVMRIYLLLNWQVILKTFVPVVRTLRGSV